MATSATACWPMATNRVLTNQLSRSVRLCVKSDSSPACYAWVMDTHIRGSMGSARNLKLLDARLADDLCKHGHLLGHTSHVLLARFCRHFEPCLRKLLAHVLPAQNVERNVFKPADDLGWCSRRRHERCVGFENKVWIARFQHGGDLRQIVPPRAAGHGKALDRAGLEVRMRGREHAGAELNGAAHQRLQRIAPARENDSRHPLQALTHLEEFGLQLRRGADGGVETLYFS